MIPETQAILGGPDAPLWALSSVLARRCAHLPVAIRDEIGASYIALGRISRIGNLLPFAQTVHETGWFTSERWLKSNNPAGLGATNDGAWGGHFTFPADGILAQYAHLLAYAAPDTALSLPQRLLVQASPRLQAMTVAWGRGSAPRWIDLNGKWAVPGPTYGQKIIELANTIWRVA